MTNIANMAWFSSDRAISEYAQEIWNVPVTDDRRHAGPGRHHDGCRRAALPNWYAICCIMRHVSCCVPL